MMARRPPKLPLDDVKKIKNQLLTVCENGVAEININSEINTQSFINLRNATCASLPLFNGRTGEPARITLEDLKDEPSGR